MKKYGTIFASVILTLMILLIPNNEVKAEELNTVSFNYENYTIYYQQASTYIEEVFNYLKSYENDYYYFIDFNGRFIETFIVEKNENVKAYMTLSSSSYGLGYSKGNKKLRSLHLHTNYSDFNVNFSNFKTKLEAGQFEYDTSTPGSSSVYGDSKYYNLHKILYYTNCSNFLFSPVNTNSLDLNGLIIQPGEKMPTYYDLYHITYDYNIQLNPNDYNFFYLKFKSLGDSSFYFKHILNSKQDLFYMIYKNLDLIYTPIVYNDTDLYIEDYFTDTNESDIYTVIVPFYKYDFIESDIFDFYFTIPGLIEYGTDKYKYTVEDGEIKEEESERSDITDLLKPGENVSEEIISSATSHNTLSNDSLNEFMWPYSLFARNGNNIKDISLIGYYSSTSIFNINDFKTNLIINYGEEDYKININNCIINNTCYLTKYEQNLIKNILFDRNVENYDYYLDFSVIPQKDVVLSNSDQFNFGISINFNSSVELTINSMMLAINDLTNSYYNVHFKLYDSKGQVHTIYKTSLDSEYIGVNQFQLYSRTADIYRVDLVFVYNHTASNISTSDNYSLKFSEFNIFANTEMIHIYTENTEATYQTCAWYDLFCHGQNLFTWLIYDAPFTSDFWTIFLYITNIFNNLWTLITYIFMPFDIIPPIFGIPISTIMPVVCFVLVLIWRMWFGGDK